jgi:antirestriction protein
MSVEDYMADGSLGHPSVYVGTYLKYNDGDLFGMWVDMVACGDYDTFMEVCHMLHADEEDPEFMYQDYENFPESWYSESGIDEDTFDKIIKFAELDEDDQEAYEAFVDSFSEDDFDTFKERYMGKLDFFLGPLSRWSDESYGCRATARYPGMGSPAGSSGNPAGRQ